MAEPTAEAPTSPAPAALPPLPAKRHRRRAVRGSYSWCWRRPPSRKRVAVTTGRFQPASAPAPEPMPFGESWH